MNNHLIKYKNHKNKYKSLILSQKNKEVQKSRNQKAGDYIFDENKITEFPSSELRKQIFHINNYNYIAGPILVCFIINKEYNKRILLFGDHHTFNDKFNCGIDDETKTIYVTTLCNTLFKKNSEKIFDVFTEASFYKDPSKIVYHKYIDSGFMNSFFYTFDICYVEREQKTECNKEVKNVRFHHMDIRSYSKYAAINKDDLTILSKNQIKFEYIYNANEQIDDIYSMLKNIVATMNDDIKQIYKKLSREFKEKVNIPSIDTIVSPHQDIDFNDIKKYDEIIKKYDEIIKELKKDKKDNKDIMHDIEGLQLKLKNYKYIVILRNKKEIYLDNEFKNFMIKYICDPERGIYSSEQLIKNAFMLCDSVPRIRRNMGINKDLIEKNYKPYYNFDELQKYNKLIAFLINYLIVIDFKIIVLLYYILALFGAMIMDIYLLS